MQLEQTFALFLIYLLFNVVVFCVYWRDKQATIKREWRVSESTLLTLALMGGSLGAVTAQQMLRHRTRKEPCRSILMLIVGLHVAAASYWLLAPSGTLAALLELMN